MSRTAAPAPGAARVARRRRAPARPFSRLAIPPTLSALLCGCVAAGAPGAPPPHVPPEPGRADASGGPGSGPGDPLVAETRGWLAASPGADRVAVDGEAADGEAAGGEAGGGAPEARRIDLDAVRVPLASILFLLARDAGLELAAHAPLDGEITHRAEDRPLAEVLDALAAQARFRWRIDGRRLVVRDDRPWSETYPVDYLNIERRVRGSVGLATRVGTMSAPGGLDAGVANGSETLVESASEHRFWASLARDLDALLAPGDGPAGTERGGRHSLNPEAGLVIVHGDAEAHRTVRAHLERLMGAARRQVLIEASVVEVTLADRFSAGIDWQRLADGVNGLNAAQLLTGVAPVARSTVDRLGAPNALATLVHAGDDGELSATLSLLESFGDVHILSRPRILALNNQASVLKVVDNRVYFTLDVERRVTEEIDEVITGTEIHTVPVGLVMNVTPHVAGDGTVMLNVRPTLSRILGFVDDPNPELAAARVRNGVPEVQVREMESMLRVASGEVAIIGGLMQDAVRDTDRGVPGLARVPLLGRLFTATRRERDRSELLVVLRPTVLEPGQAAPAPLVAPRVPGREATPR